MTWTHRLGLCVFALACAAGPASALAQEADGAFRSLQRALNAGDVIMVVDARGRTTLGRVVEISPTKLTVTEIRVDTQQDRVLTTPGDTVTFEPAGVVSIARSDLALTRGDILYGREGTFLTLPEKLRVGQIAEVTDLRGRRTLGKVLEVSASSLVVLLDGEDSVAGQAGLTETYTPATVTRIRRVGVLWDGAVKGAIVGALIPILAGALQYEEGWKFMFPIAGMGAGIGVGIDALFGPKTVYRASQRATSMTLAPVMTKERRGMLFTWRF